jgi:catechol 2,3-dioxygenase-like lactoylglutathione lyase family enzyme
VTINIDSHIVFLATTDLSLTAAFYEETIGLTLALDQGKCRIYRVAAKAYLGFCAGADRSPTEGVIVTLVSRDVDAWYRQLKAQGVKFEKKPAYNPEFNIYHFFLRDPNGYLLEIQRFEDPRWQDG